MRESLFAVFGDIHANLEALEAVLADMETLSIGERVCLGDTVGYAANPAKCLQRVRGLGCPVLKGNHDEAAAGDGDLYGMRDIAQAGIEFARSKLTEEQRHYLATLPMTWANDRIECVHASLDQPGEWNYVMREYDALDHFLVQRKPLCFCGHTHVPMIWHLSENGTLRACHGQGRIEVPAHGKILVNVGSVGQPRDAQPEACYVVYNETAKWVEFRRVAYDIGKARRKIHRARLPRLIASRLLVGQ